MADKFGLYLKPGNIARAGVCKAPHVSPARRRRGCKIISKELKRLPEEFAARSGILRGSPNATQRLVTARIGKPTRLVPKHTLERVYKQFSNIKRVQHTPDRRNPQY